MQNRNFQMPQINNEFWSLSLNLGFRKIKTVYEYQPCECQNKFCLVEDYPCSKCYGKGEIRVEIKYPVKPEIPNSLVEHLSKAYKEWTESKGDV